MNKRKIFISTVVGPLRREIISTMVTAEQDALTTESLSTMHRADMAWRRGDYPGISLPAFSSLIDQALDQLAKYPADTPNVNQYVASDDDYIVVEYGWQTVAEMSEKPNNNLPSS